MYVAPQSVSPARRRALLGELGKIRRRPRLSGLGDSPGFFSTVEGWLSPTGSPNAYGGASAGASFNNAGESPIIPGSSVSDVLYNMATGDVSPSQQQALVAQTTAEYQQAGLSPSDSATQAYNDVSAALSTVQAPGAFNVTWTGAQPGQTLPAAAVSSLTGGLSSIPSWAWLAAGGLGLFLVFKLVKP